MSLKGFAITAFLALAVAIGVAPEPAEQLAKAERESEAGCIALATFNLVGDDRSKWLETTRFFIFSRTRHACMEPWFSDDYQRPSEEVGDELYAMALRELGGEAP